MIFKGEKFIAFVIPLKQVQHNVNNNLMDMQECQDRQERQDERTHNEVWQDYVNDQLDWLKYFYQAAGEKGVEAYKKAESAFTELQNKLKSSHYNKNDNYFKTFAKLQREKYFRKKPFSIKNIFKGKLASSILSSHAEGLVMQSKEKIYLLSLYQNFKSIVQYLTLERYNLTNIVKHIFRKYFNEEYQGEQIECFTFDVERGMVVKWQQYGSEVLLYVFIKGTSKGIMELQAKGIFHLDLVLRNILLFGCQNVSDLLDPLKIANNQELTFKITDFDNSLLVGKAHINKTIQIFAIRQKILNQGFYENYNLVDFKKLNNDAIRYMEKEHSQQFATCFDNLINQKKIVLARQDEKQLKNMIVNRDYEDLIKKMDENIKNIKNQNGQR